MSDIILYGNPRSTYVRTARIAAEEKGVSYALEGIDLASDDYRQIHPFAKMPAMRHGDTVIYETAAIGVYIDACFDGPALQPAAALEQARMWQWVSAINAYFYATMIRSYALHYVFPSGPDGTPNRELIDATLPELKRQLALVDAALAESDFLAGSSYSLADMFLTPIMTYLSRLPESGEMLGELANIQRAGAAVTARASTAATMPEMPQAA